MIARPSTALKLGDEQGSLDQRIKLVQEGAGVAVPTERDGPEPFTGQFPKPLFCTRYGLWIGEIELMPRVAIAIHDNLNSHVWNLWLLACP
jgi:hypothetical protein